MARILLFERREAHGRIATELAPQRRPERLHQIGAGTEHEPQTGVVDDLPADGMP